MPYLELGVYIKLCKFCIKFALIEEAHDLVEKLHSQGSSISLSPTHFCLQQTAKCFLALIPHL